MQSCIGVIRRNPNKQKTKDEVIRRSLDRIRISAGTPLPSNPSRHSKVTLTKKKFLYIFTFKNMNFKHPTSLYKWSDKLLEYIKSSLFGIVQQHSKPIVRLFIKAPKLVHMLTNVFWTILHMEPLGILPWSALADQGTISGGSISRIVRNTLFYMCTNFGAFMQIWTIDLKYQTTLQDSRWVPRGIAPMFNISAPLQI